MSTRPLGGVVLAAALVASCAENRAPVVHQGTLGPGMAARVGTDDVSLTTVERIVRARGVTPRAANPPSQPAAISAFARAACTSGLPSSPNRACCRASKSTSCAAPSIP